MDSRYIELANRIGLGQSNRIAKLFEIIVDPEEAQLLLALPGTPPALVHIHASNSKGLRVRLPLDAALRSRKFLKS